MKFLKAIKASFREAFRKSSTQRAIDEAHSGNFAEAFRCIDAGGDINATGHTSTNGRVSYEGNIGYAAIRFGNVDVLTKALDRGLDVNLVSPSSPPMLVYAILCQQEEVARLLVARGANLAPVTEDGPNPIALAHSNGMIRLVETMNERVGAPETERHITVRKPIRLKK